MGYMVDWNTQCADCVRGGTKGNFAPVPVQNERVYAKLGEALNKQQRKTILANFNLKNKTNPLINTLSLCTVL